MRLTLTDTGPAGGFPVPGCPCAVCSRARRAGVSARPSRLSSSEGWSIGMDGVARGEPSGTRFETVDEGVVVVSGEWGSVIWAPQAGEIGEPGLRRLAEVLGKSAGIEDGEPHALLLGPVPDSPESDGEMPSVACARSLARLRAEKLVGPDTRCVLIGLGHRETHPSRLEACLPVWGAELGSSGLVLEVSGAAGSEVVRPAVERVLVLGGSGSGKSAFAEQMLSAAPAVVYLATGPKPVASEDSGARSGADAEAGEGEEALPTEHAEDDEWAARVKKHQDRRPGWWSTLETVDVAEPLAQEGRAILLDSVGTWLSGVLDRCGAWEERPGWREELDAEIAGLLTAWRERTAPLVAVSDEVGWSIVPSTESGRMFREELGRLNAKLADASEDVFVVVAGRLLRTDP